MTQAILNRQGLQDWHVAAFGISIQNLSIMASSLHCNMEDVSPICCTTPNQLDSEVVE